MPLVFSTLHLIIGDTSPTDEVMRSIFNDDEEENYSIDKHHHIITKKCVGEDCFWIYVRYGKELPYTSTVIDSVSKKEENNPRTKQQIEPDKQIFGLYSITKKALFMSDARKNSLLEKYLQDKLKSSVTIKSFFIGVDEFIKNIKSVEQIKFVTKRNLFSNDGGLVTISPEHKDIFGLGVPEDYSIEANYKNVKLTETCISNLRRMAGWKQSLEAESLICIGRDDKNIETIFNVDSIRQKISIPVEKDENGMYDHEAVLLQLLLKLKES